MKQTSFINKNITFGSITTLLKTILVGLALAETYFLSTFVVERLMKSIVILNYELIAVSLGISLISLTAIYIIIRESEQDCVRIMKSKRFDIFGLVLVGMIISYLEKGIGSKQYHRLVDRFTDQQIILFILLPFVVSIAICARAIQLKKKNAEITEPFFLTDIEGKKKENDLLGHSEQAIRFAERVFNGGSSDSLVFGIDAPWGIGKSTFVNYCIETWKKDEKYKDQVIVYKFNPLRYEDRSNLFEKFIDGLVATLQNASFSPEIRPLVSKYSRLIKSKGSFKFLGMEFELFPGRDTVDNVFVDLEDALKNFDKKIIIVVDDLDRIGFSAIKDVLFAVKKSFTLPNISYVLCYETENIVALEKDISSADKIRESLEKFVNVKISLFLNSDILAKYVSENFKIALQENLQLGARTRDKLIEAVDVLVDIYKSSDFDNYQPFLGDIRKLKRLINTMMLFEIEQVDFDNSDFEKKDLVNLMLIYINYPNIFRQIYNTETKGRRGFFSAIIPYDDGYPTPRHGSRASDENYENSTQYTDFVRDKLTENQRFLVDQVFNVSIRFPKGRQISEISEVMKKTYACFNGDGLWSGGRNLEEYLNLIVKLARPQKRTQYRFYLNSKEKIKKGTKVEEVLSDEDYSFLKSESSHEQLWRVVVNSSSDLVEDVGRGVIRYLLNHITDYSLFTNEKIGVGFRDDLGYSLVKLLDVVGWADSDGLHRQNHNENNLVEITDWIFGENSHVGEGVLETLSQGSRGVVGLYDLMIFRLFCSSDRGGEIFNLERALTRHSNPSVQSNGLVVEEMREISQRVFAIFKEQYISKSKNIFQLIDSLTLKDLAGNYFEYVEKQIMLGTMTIEERDTAIEVLKSKMKSFITYQLGNNFISHGVGCGYYDESGSADGKGIALEINNYLFDICFNPGINPNGYECFIDYLLINFADVFSSSRRGGEFVPHIDEFTKVIDRTRLLEYWRKNSTKIKSLDLEKKDKKVATGNYTAIYSEDILGVYEVLDKSLGEMTLEAEKLLALPQPETVQTEQESDKLDTEEGEISHE